MKRSHETRKVFSGCSTPAPCTEGGVGEGWGAETRGSGGFPGGWGARWGLSHVL